MRLIFFATGFTAVTGDLISLLAPGLFNPTVTDLAALRLIALFHPKIREVKRQLLEKAWISVLREFIIRLWICALNIKWRLKMKSVVCTGNWLVLQLFTDDSCFCNISTGSLYWNSNQETGLKKIVNFSCQRCNARWPFVNTINYVAYLAQSGKGAWQRKGQRWHYAPAIFHWCCAGRSLPFTCWFAAWKQLPW